MDTATATATRNAPPAAEAQPRRAATGAGAGRTDFPAETTQVCVVGLGYIGLPTASLLASRGYTVHGVEIAADIVSTINLGAAHFAEPDLDALVRGAVQSGRLRAALEARQADVYILAVPTNARADGTPELSAVGAAARAIAPHVRRGALVILESTVPVGTTEGLVGGALEAVGLRVGEDVLLAHCPERVLPGRILTEIVENDRVVGGVNQASTEAAVRFYEGFVKGEVIGTDARTAEMVKLAENSFRDVNIAFANELSMIAGRHGISVWNLIRLANRHPRVSILQPGPGVGGHCIAVDPWFLHAGAPELARLVRTAREVNDSKPEWVLRRVQACLQRVREPVIACLGLAFKADVDDLRESPAVEIVRRLRAEAEAEILVVEPNLQSHPEFDLVDVTTALERANVVLVLTDHRQFRRIDRELLQERILIDTRGMFL